MISRPALLLMAAATLPLTCRGAEVFIPLGASLQNAIDASPAHSELVLAPGAHYGENIRLRSGDVLRGSPGAKLTGSLEIRDAVDVEVRELRLDSMSGDCVRIRDAESIRIRASEIGPCAGNGIDIRRSEAVLVTDNYIHPEHRVFRCCDTGDAIYSLDSRQLRIAGNVIAFGESNVELHGVDGAEIVGNYLLNPLGPFPRGQQVQAYFGCRDIRIEGNYMEASRDASFPFPERQEDAVNAGQSTDVAVTGNFITGGSSASGCGIIADQDAHRMSIIDNTLVETGQCGIGIASGRDHRIIGNKVSNSFLDQPGAGNTAIYVWRQYAGDCGPVRVSGNTAYARKPSGEPSSFWKGSPSCDPVTLSHNVFGEQARGALPEALLNSLRPSIPPQPQHCLAPAPFVTNNQRSCIAESPSEQQPRTPIRARTQLLESP